MEFDDIIGNEKIKLQLKIAATAAVQTNTSVPHTLFAGAAGCGKTTMSNALANALGSDFVKLPAESIKSSKDIEQLAENLNVSGYTRNGEIVGKINPTIVFVDEIHKISISGQEALGMAMEEWYISSKSPYTGEIEEMWLPKFTLVGATTNTGRLSKPFRDRFKITFQFNTYPLEEGALIVKKHAEIRNWKIEDDAALTIARRGRGVPRILVRFLERAHDIAVVSNKEVIDEGLALAAFELLGIDDTGLGELDIKLLKALQEAGQPIGIETLSIILNESGGSIQRAMEPYMIQRGLIIRTGRGRIITKAGMEYLRERGYIESKRRFAG